MADRKQAAPQESVISRWSRRKLEAEEATPDIDLATPEVDAAGLEPVPVEEAPELTDADMPAVETLTHDSDFTGFMSPGVSDKLRNIALRKLFHAPVFNIRDGLDEYDEDYTSFEKLGDIVTCDMKHQIVVQERKKREALELEREQAALEDAELDDVEAIDEEAGDEAVTEAAGGDEAASEAVVSDETVDPGIDDEKQQQASQASGTDRIARTDNKHE